MADNNSNDIILQEKFRNPITKKWDLAAPIKIQRDGTILLEGKLITKDAVETNNIQDGAVNHSKIGQGAVETDNIQDKAVNHAKLGIKAVETDNIQNGAITLDHFSENLQITRDYINVFNILGTASVDTDNNIRAVSSETIRRNAITHSKLFGSDVSSEDEGKEGIDDQPPVWGENIKNESIQFNHIYNPYGCPKASKDWRPIDGNAHIAKRSIPLNKLSEPIYTLKDEGEGNYTLNLYHVNGDVGRYDNTSSQAWEAALTKANGILNNPNNHTEAEIQSANATITAINRWQRNNGKNYYINIYDPDSTNNNNEIWSWDYSKQEEHERGIEEEIEESSSSSSS